MHNKFYRSIAFAGIGLLRAKQLMQLQRIEDDAHELLLTLAMRHGASSLNVKSQIGQDLFALYAVNWKRKGFFVEFGATNGIDLSNSYLLEKDFGWEGILAEPARVWHSELTRNRSALIEFDCVWKESGKKLQFAVSESAEYSTIGEFIDKDAHKKSRNSIKLQEVSTISLNDLLDRHDAPEVIDYLSIDTEGSEYEILRSYDFAKRRILVITCEHNFSDQRSRINELLVSKGYKRVFEGLSRWDDWYIHSSLEK
jgi:FkbM family methyltransferase